MVQLTAYIKMEQRDPKASDLEGLQFMYIWCFAHSGSDISHDVLILRATGSEGTTYTNGFMEICNCTASYIIDRLLNRPSLEPVYRDGYIV